MDSSLWVSKLNQQLFAANLVLRKWPKFQCILGTHRSGDLLSTQQYDEYDHSDDEQTADRDADDCSCKTTAKQRLNARAA